MFEVRFFSSYGLIRHYFGDFGLALDFGRSLYLIWRNELYNDLVFHVLLLDRCHHITYDCSDFYDYFGIS